MHEIVESLLESPEPAIRAKVRTQMLGEPVQPIEDSDVVRRLLAPFQKAEWPHAYAGWHGVHWALAALADLGYPPGDEALHPMRDQVLDTWLQDNYYKEFEADSRAATYRMRAGVPLVRGSYRQHGSQQGNALWFLTVLGLDDGRCADLAERLMFWQWPGGGWNCDRNPAADTSSLMETVLPMRGLWAYGTPETRVAARKAAEVLLERRVIYRRSDGSLIRKEFGKLHYPVYWHYDVLSGLKALMELGLLDDPRCADALDLLESMKLTDGWPAHASYGQSADRAIWGGTSTRKASPRVTADALAVLAASGRW